ncbi:MAG: hypothetical protein LBR80_04545 [Deltaproteobacteria bacterium]|nr:hypothetical protein [Deltaproteobacteria bacterium]
MQDIYEMNRHESVAVAKIIKIETIYAASSIDCPELSYQDVQTMLYGLSVNNVPVKCMVTVLDVHNGWRKMLDLLDRQTDLDCMSEINSFATHYLAGGFAPPWEEKPIATERRIGPDNASKELNTLLSMDVCETEKALRLFLWCCQRKPFNLGNRRTGYLAANRHLIATGRGVLVVVEDEMPTFRTLFAQFELDGTDGELLDFLLEKCISGIIYGPPGAFV